MLRHKIYDLEPSTPHILAMALAYSAVCQRCFRQLAFSELYVSGAAKMSLDKKKKKHQNHGITSFKIPLHALHSVGKISWMAPERRVLKIQSFLPSASLCLGVSLGKCLCVSSHNCLPALRVRPVSESSQRVNS